MLIALLFSTFGPYHVARLASTRSIAKVVGVQLEARSSEYSWEEDSVQGVVTLFSETRCLSKKAINEGVFAALNRLRPDTVAVPGWYGTFALAALRWALIWRRPAVLLSDSQKLDAPRRFWREWVKSRIISRYSTALVGGTRHVDYLSDLGMARDRIFLGYDAVDNDYFQKKTEEVRSHKLEVRKRYGLPENYFLASARFIEKKNLPGLLRAYADYRELACNSAFRTAHSEPWDLVLLGDGPLRETLDSQLSTLNLREHVLMPGFKQYSDLPAYYGLAAAFVHASTTEQWGLVVNEAMASGLPVLVSNRCGCVTELVREGVNGFTFDPRDVEGLAKLMFRISTLSTPQLSNMRIESQRIIGEWGPRHFADGLKAAADMALNLGPPVSNRLSLSILAALGGRLRSVLTDSKPAMGQPS
jgi:glycosyltransferase involved in cell wall biosynthesis